MAQHSKVVVKREGKTIKVAQARVQDVIDMMEANHRELRSDLIADLEAGKIDDAGKVKALEELRAKKGITSDLIRSAFTLPGAKRIIEHQAEPDDLEQLLNTTPDRIVELALQVIGWDPEPEEEAKGEDESSPT
tara:strand:+ start:2868 stop:3269 length:402 start_codon:yes stop_codon:yes gene_type:complete